MWILVPFIIQAIALVFDEGYFHLKRGLPKWERIGHPLDTLSYLLCMTIVLFVPFSTWNLGLYIFFGVASCLLVTKDEFVHKDHCPGAENWLHALLFILHPITLILMGMIWIAVDGQELPIFLAAWFDNPEGLNLFLYFQYGVIWTFCFYQIIFWNLVWKDKPVLKI